MRYRLLGPFEVWDSERQIQLAHKWRILLAVLLINANRAVSVDRLLSELYGEKLPSSSTKLVQLYVSRLRRALGDPAGEVLTTGPTGYRLAVGPDELDSMRFERLAAEGRTALAAGQCDVAADRLGAALAMWRGPVLADLASGDGWRRTTLPPQAPRSRRGWRPRKREAGHGNRRRERKNKAAWRSSTPLHDGNDPAGGAPVNRANAVAASE